MCGFCDQVEMRCMIDYVIIMRGQSPWIRVVTPLWSAHLNEAPVIHQGTIQLMDSICHRFFILKFLARKLYCVLLDYMLLLLFSPHSPLLLQHQDSIEQHIEMYITLRLRNE